MTVSWWGLAINLAIVALLFWWWRRAREERIRTEEEREGEVAPGGDPEAWERARRRRGKDAPGAAQATPGAAEGTPDAAEGTPDAAGKRAGRG